MRRSRRQRAKRRRVWRLTLTGSLLLFIGFLAFLFTRIHPDAPEKNKSDRVQFTPSHSEVKDEKSVARIMINGDFLYHDVLYWSAEIGNGYDFSKNFAYVKDFIAESDLAIGDFEGTIMPGRELCGYPLFNAPKEVAEAIVDAGYQVIALANNHILDMGLAGLQSTAEIFSEYGADVIGVYPDGNRNKENILIKNINGIQIALLNYAYGFNGMEQNLTVSEYEQYMK